MHFELETERPKSEVLESLRRRLQAGSLLGSSAPQSFAVRFNTGYRVALIVEAVGWVAEANSRTVMRGELRVRGIPVAVFACAALAVSGARWVAAVAGAFCVLVGVKQVREQRRALFSILDAVAHEL